MILFSDQLYTGMQEALHLLNYESCTELQKIRQSITIINAHLRKLNEFISIYEFATKEEEIRYFKQVRPMFSKEIFYYTALLEIEADRPVADPQTIIEYYRGHITQFNLRLQKFHFLYRYHLLGEDYMDGSLFTRNPENNIPTMYLNGSDLDNRVSNVYSSKLSELQATEELVAHLNCNIEAMEKGSTAGNTNKDKSPGVFWKGTKAQFYELVYALVNSGSITGNIKEAMEWLGHCLNIAPSNYYGYHQSMRIRKKSRTPFLDLLKKFFLKYMDDNDEYPRFK